MQPNIPPASPSRARPTNWSPSASRRRSPWWTFGCSITSSSARVSACRWRNVGFC